MKKVSKPTQYPSEASVSYFLEKRIARENGALIHWIVQCTEPNGASRISDLYEAFVLWTRPIYGTAIPLRSFSERLMGLGFEWVRYPGGKRVRPLSLKADCPSVLALWLHDRCVVDGKGKASLSELSESFSAWSGYDVSTVRMGKLLPFPRYMSNGRPMCKGVRLK